MFFHLCGLIYVETVTIISMRSSNKPHHYLMKKILQIDLHFLSSFSFIYFFFFNIYKLLKTLIALDML